MTKKKLNILFLISVVFLSIDISFAKPNNPFLSKKKYGKSNFSTEKNTVHIVFDASKSMEDTINGESKMHIAKRVLDKVLKNTDSDLNIGLRVYGSSDPTGNSQNDCSDSKVLVLPGVNNRRTIISEANKVLPRGYTPITYSLVEAIHDLVPYKGEKSIVLIGDGQETCGNDPCLLASKLKDQNVNLKIDVVGFGIADDLLAQKQLMCVALQTMGRYFAANSAEELTRSLNESFAKNVSGRVITNIKDSKNTDVKDNSTFSEIYNNLLMDH